MSNESVPVIGRVESANDPNSKGIFSRSADAIAVGQVSLSSLRQELESIINAFSALSHVGEDSTAKGLSLAEFEISLEISATGKVSILGTGLESSAVGGVRLLFARPE